MNHIEFQKKLIDEGLEDLNAHKIIKNICSGGELSEEKARKIINIIKIYSKLMGRDPLIFNDYIESDFLLIYVDDRIDPLKEKYKKFGLKVPFDSWEEAYRWIKKESLEGILNTPRLELPEYENKPLWKDPNLYEAFSINLSIEKTQDGFKDVRCNKSPFLLELRYELIRLEELTGFEIVDLVKYFFCNIRPELKRIIYSKTSILNSIRKIQFNCTDITREEFKELYDKFREDVQLTHKKRQSEKQKRFSIFIKNNPKQNNQTSKDWYKELVLKWNQEYPDMEVKNWNAMRRKYETFKNKREIEISEFMKSIIFQKNKSTL